MVFFLSPGCCVSASAECGGAGGCEGPCGYSGINAALPKQGGETHRGGLRISHAQ